MSEAILQLASFIGFVLRIYYFVVIARVLMSWLRPDPMNPVVRFILKITDPPMNGLKRALPFLQAGMIDFTPIALLFLLELLQQIVSTLLLRLATQLA